ncbi:HD-GYP domain-containing protein [Thermotoga caldifontis]|uniref:HD-GYP domain-containing protein n=1 Tax=Thermotoga caldifontis TaxID=1508419 RepID=UPI0011861A35|nr:HD-GYP domain-containing protein [Thermotoga caldifontis]
MYLEAEVGQYVLKNVGSLTGLETSLETITDRNGSIVVRAGERITPEKIELLKSNGVNRIWVKVEEVLPPLVDVRKIDEAKEQIQQVFDTVATKLRIETEQVWRVSQTVLNDIVRNYGDKISLVFLVQQTDEDYTYTHEVHVSMISSLVGLEMGLKLEELSHLAFSAMIHDVGKALVPKEILLASRKLTPEEFEIMKKHVAFGERICRQSGLNDERVISSVRDHHEKLDGSGYLSGLSDRQISLFARIVSVVDIYDALVSNRSYKPSWTPYKAMTEIIRLASLNKLDAKVVKSMVSLLGLYPIGTTVVLNEGTKAIVVGVNRRNPLRPIVQIENGETIDLTEEKNLRVVSVLE